MSGTGVPPSRAIQRKRDGGELSSDEVREFFSGYADGTIPDYQASALLMAIFLRGLSARELSDLVSVMLHSGAVVDLSSLPAPKVDKHSTGGVGDKISLVLAPLAASLGLCVPMMSGRGLGHTGGTLDKLETIPGFRTDLSLKEFQEQLERIGCALIGQTGEIAPLDRKMYALRDVTGTVESIPLIASSIMSKKLAEGIDGLVLDVKFGSGAFLPDPDRATELAQTMIGIGAAHGREVVALLTAMDRPHGHAIGNALEVEEAIEVLKGRGPADVRELTLALVAEMLRIGGMAASVAEGMRAAARALDDGSALEKMREIVEAQGGNPAVLDDPALLPQAPVQRSVEAPAAGHVAQMDVRAIGLAAVELGAGRRSLDSKIDPAVGFHLTAKPGDRVEKGQVIATVHAATDAAADAALAALGQAISYIEMGAELPPPVPLIAKRITARGVADWADWKGGEDTAPDVA